MFKILVDFKSKKENKMEAAVMRFKSSFILISFTVKRANSVLSQLTRAKSRERKTEEGQRALYIRTRGKDAK